MLTLLMGFREITAEAQSPDALRQSMAWELTDSAARLERNRCSMHL
jgi:hypothetical protein